MSLAAVPVFLYGRRLMPAGLRARSPRRSTLASPLLLYSGLVMTEVLFYPLAALALLAVARAVETAARCATRRSRSALIVRRDADARPGGRLPRRVRGRVVVDALLARDRTQAALRSGRSGLVARRGRSSRSRAPGALRRLLGNAHGGYPLGAAAAPRPTTTWRTSLVDGRRRCRSPRSCVLLVEAVRGRERDPARARCWP